MSTAPDVLYLVGDELFDETATAWDARTLAPLVPATPVAPLTHRDDCYMAPWPDLAACCPCTANQRYTRRRTGVAS